MPIRLDFLVFGALELHLFLIGLIFANLIFPIIAIVKTATNPDKAYRYPSVIRFF